MYLPFNLRLKEELTIHEFINRLTYNSSVIFMMGLCKKDIAQYCVDLVDYSVPFHGLLIHSICLNRFDGFSLYWACFDSVSIHDGFGFGLLLCKIFTWVFTNVSDPLPCTIWAHGDLLIW